MTLNLKRRGTLKKLIGKRKLLANRTEDQIIEFLCCVFEKNQTIKIIKSYCL